MIVVKTLDSRESGIVALENLEKVMVQDQGKDKVQLPFSLDGGIFEGSSAELGQELGQGQVCVVGACDEAREGGSEGSEGKGLLGCGSVKYYEAFSYAELRGIFVIREARRQGIAKRIVAGLEGSLIFRSQSGDVRLAVKADKTGAIRLYSGLGYKRRGSFGGYLDDGSWVFMEKGLFDDLGCEKNENHGKS